MLGRFLKTHRFACLAGLFILLELLGWSLSPLSRSLAPETFLGTAQVMLATHALPVRFDYPPLVPVVMYGLMQVFHQTTLNLILFNGGALLLAAAAFYFLLVQLPLSGRERLGVFIAAFLNPYFLWLVFISKDTVFEAGFLFLFFALAYRVLGREDQERLQSSRAVALILALVAVGTLGFLCRVTTLFAALVGCVMFFLLAKTSGKKIFAGVFVGLLCTGALFAGFNASRGGGFTLSTTLGLDVLYGNHPLYDYGHPRHDIDVFIPGAISPDASEVDNYTSANNTRFLKLGLDYIRARPMAFFMHSIEKSYWLWFNFEKIPNLSSNTQIISLVGDTLTLKLSNVNYASSLFYLLYKLVYVPVFLFALIVLICFNRLILWRLAALLAPIISLWPIVVLTFPDTRFKIVGELLAVPFIYIAAKYGVMALRASRDKLIERQIGG